MPFTGGSKAGGGADENGVAHFFFHMLDDIAEMRLGDEHIFCCFVDGLTTVSFQNIGEILNIHRLSSLHSTSQKLNRRFHLSTNALQVYVGAVRCVCQDCNGQYSDDVPAVKSGLGRVCYAGGTIQATVRSRGIGKRDRMLVFRISGNYTFCVTISQRMDVHKKFKFWRLHNEYKHQDSRDSKISAGQNSGCH